MMFCLRSMAKASHELASSIAFLLTGIVMTSCGGSTHVAGLPGTETTLAEPTNSASIASDDEQTSPADEAPADADDGATRPSAALHAARLAELYDGAKPIRVQSGEASYYADKFIGRRTASGEPYDAEQLTSAHRTLPFGSIVRVVRLDEAKAVYVRVTDRGPFGKRSRVIDVSRAAARELDMLRAGVVPVRLEVVALPAE